MYRCRGITRELTSDPLQHIAICSWWVDIDYNNDTSIIGRVNRLKCHTARHYWFSIGLCYQTLWLSVKCFTFIWFFIRQFFYLWISELLLFNLLVLLLAAAPPAGIVIIPGIKSFHSRSSSFFQFTRNRERNFL